MNRLKKIFCFLGFHPRVEWTMVFIGPPKWTCHECGRSDWLGG